MATETRAALTDQQTLHLRRLTEREHLEFIRSTTNASFLQCPSWGRVKAGWSAESLGWVTRSGRLVGAALILYKPIPALKRYFAYLPEGPVIDWTDPDLARWLEPLVSHVRAQGAFVVKIGPQLALRRWDTASVKLGIADPGIKRLNDVPADVVDATALRVARQLQAMGWRRNTRPTGSFFDYQPRFIFHIPLAGRGIDDVRLNFNATWRRNIKKAANAGVRLTEGGYDDLPVFHSLVARTGRRSGFIPRPLSYYQRQYRELTAEDPERMRLFLATFEDEVLAAATMLRVGERAWFQSGGSTHHNRQVRPSNALQWHLIQEAHKRGASFYDMRGISDSLDQNDALCGLTRFKLGTGGQAAERLGEWDFTLNRTLHRGFVVFTSRRSGTIANQPA